MPLVLYTLTAVALLAIASRWITPISRRAALALFAMPFAFVGYALLTGRVYGPVDLPYLAPPLNWMKVQHGISELHNGLLSDVACQMIPWRKAVQWSLQQGQWPLWNPFILSGDILAGAGQPAAYSPFTLLACLLPVAQSLTFSAAITHFLAILGAFLFARELGCRESAALVASAGFSFSTCIALFILWPLGASWVWLPFVLLGVKRNSIALLTGAFVLLLLSGHPETALHVVFLAGAYALFERRVAKPIIAGVLALLVCAIYILPILEAAPQTMEHAYRTEVFAKESRGVDSEEVVARLAMTIFPTVDSQLPDNPAVGSIVLVLAIFAIWRVRNRYTWFFAGTAVFCLLAHAEWKPLAIALSKLPLFDLALNERFSFGAAFALSMLAALGVNELRIRNFPAVLVALILLQRVISDGGLYRSFDADVAYPPIPILEPTKHVREPFRITGHGLSFIPGTSALYELEDVRGYEAMTFAPYFETYPLFAKHQPVWFNRVDDLEKPFLDFLNVRFAITWDREPPRVGWREVARQRGSVLLENTQVIERAFVPRHVRINGDALSEMERETDFRERAWIRAELPKQERANGPGRVANIRWRKLGYDFDAAMDGDGWVVTSIPAWKGWRAYIDGRRVETQIANVAFVSVHVPRGRHRVRLGYWPRGFVIGRAITVCTVIALALYCIVASFFSRLAIRRSLR